MFTKYEFRKFENEWIRRAKCLYKDSWDIAQLKYQQIS